MHGITSPRDTVGGTSSAGAGGGASCGTDSQLCETVSRRYSGTADAGSDEPLEALGTVPPVPKTVTPPEHRRLNVRFCW